MRADLVPDGPVCSVYSPGPVFPLTGKGYRAVCTVGPASSGSCPRVLASAAALGFQCPIAPLPSHQWSGTWGTGVGGPVPFGSPHVSPSFQALGSCLGATVLPGVFREVGTDFTPGVRRWGCLVWPLGSRQEESLVVSFSDAAQSLACRVSEGSCSFLVLYRCLYRRMWHSAGSLLQLLTRSSRTGGVGGV